MNRLSLRFDWLVAFGLFGLALFLRLPNLYLQPRFIDEGLEVMWGLDITRGMHLPLTGYDPYYGPLYYYLIAGLLRVLGPNLWAPRLFVAIFAALVTVPAYWLGLKMGNRATGVLTAVLVAANPTMIVWSSHYAWSNSLSPFFATLTFCVFYIGVTAKRDSWLIASGLLAALTVQTHPITFVGAVGMFVWFLLSPQGRARLKEPAPYLAVAFFVLGYSPILVANLQNIGALTGSAHDHAYAFTPTLDPNVYFTRLSNMVFAVSSTAGDWVSGKNVVGRQPFVILGGLLAIVGLLWSARRGNWFPLVIIASAVLILPTFLPTYNGASNRYITFLLPLLFITFAMFLTQLRFLLQWNLTGRRVWIAALVVLFLVASGVMLTRYYRLVSAENDTNADIYHLDTILHQQGACNGNSFIENGNEELHTRFPIPAYNNIRYTLTLDSCPFQAGAPAHLVENLAQQGANGWLIIPQSDASLYRQHFDLVEVPFKNLPRSPIDPFDLYRVFPKGSVGG